MEIMGSFFIYLEMKNDPFTAAENAGLAKVAIEAKKADDPDLAHGFTHQLPAYMDRLKAIHGR